MAWDSATETVSGWAAVWDWGTETAWGWAMAWDSEMVKAPAVALAAASAAVWGKGCVWR